MKNLFKKMMLVAVAAMAFVACSQDNDEINATVKKTDVVFNLSIEDVTRAYFGEEQGSGSDTSFPSYWSGDESVTLVAYDTNDVVVSTAWGSIEAEGEQATQARVAATFNDDLAGVVKVRAYVGSWSYDEPRVPEVGQEQYMEKEGTVASNAHTMSAEAAWDGVAQSIDLNFSHAVAYGRMQIKSIVGIDDVNDVTITKAIVKVDEAEYQVSLNSELDTKYIWFACDADDAIATLDIEVKASNGRSYVKTIDMTAAANPLKFRTGEVSKFAVSGLVEKVEETYPVFTSASWTNVNTHDKLIKFWGEGGITMSLNFSYCNSDNFIDLGEYTIEPNAEGPWKIYGATGTDWCKYVDADANEYGMLGGKVNVSAVGGEYVIEFIDLQLVDLFYNPVGTLPYAKFTGSIENMIVPDNRTKLAKPTNVQVSVSGKTITTTWKAVAGADGYLFELYNPVDEAFTQIVEGTSFSFTGLNSNWNYYFKLTAYASDENPRYRSSDEIYLEKRTEDTDPKIELSPEALSFSADGGSETVEVTLKNMPDVVDFAFATDADWLTIERSGNILTVTALGYEDETQNREALITITAGDVTKDITVFQSMKTAAGGIRILSINVGYDQPGEKEIQFVFTGSGACHVIDFKGSRVKTGQPLEAGYYSSGEYTIDEDYCVYDYGTTNGTPTFVDCTVTNNADGTQTYEARMVYNGQTYSWTYTGNYPA